MTSSSSPSRPTVWLQAREKRWIAREKHRRQMLEQLNAVLGVLAGKYQWKELFLFGSIVNPDRFSENSDVDVAVSGLAKHNLFSFMAELSRELGRDVDVLILEESPIEEHIRRKGEPWPLQRH